MRNRVDPGQSLYMVDMLIRALSDEMAQQRSHAVESELKDGFLVQMEEALYGLRLRKMLLSATRGADYDNTLQQC